MHRFGRSGQLRKDRWGGSFILIAALALGSAYFIGDYMNKTWFADKSATSGTLDDNQLGVETEGKLNPVVASQPAAFELYTVQVGAFKSPTSAQNMAQKMNGAGYVGFANVNPSGTSYAYAGGVFTDKAKARAFLDDLKASSVIDDGFVAKLSVPYGPEAITAMAGDNKSSVSNGYSTMNTYLQEVANWIESRAEGQDNPVADMVSLGKGLTSLANELEKSELTDEKMKQFVALAREAGQHAEMLQSAAGTMDTSAEYMKVLNGYVSLLAHYNSLQENVTASAN